MHPKYLTIFAILLSLLIPPSTSLPLLWPQPKHFNYNTSSLPLKISPCDINYRINSPLISLVNNTLNHYLTEVFRCQQKKASNVTLAITTFGRQVNLPLETVQQSYSLVLRKQGNWQLTSQEITGFMRGIQTFSQLFQKNQQEQFFVQGLPIVIDDEPEFKWRGLMIDTSRHFMKLSFIKKIVLSLLYNKMNVLHWHIVDQDSFPLQIQTVPQLSEFGSVAGNYSMPQIQRQIINYAKNLGIRVVFEIDTPAHTHSWGRSTKYSDMVVRCNNVYTGQFDPTLNVTYEVVTKVMEYVNKFSEDPYIHFGGDETSDSCWDLKPSIKDWMSLNNITTYNQLSSMYRKKQKSIWRTISKTKKAIYWANQAIDLPLQADDVLHWWGLTKNLDRLKNRTNEIILSSYDIGYLDVGFGNRNGIPYGNYINWRNIYSLNPYITGVNVIGGEACMWAELSNQHTFEQKVWIRTSVLSERLWNSEIKIQSELNNIAQRLVAQARRLNSRGFKTSPVTVQLCEQNLSICF